MSVEAPTLAVPATDGALRLERHDELEALREEWTALAEACGNPFSTWEWAATWWRHFGGDHRLEITACRRPDGSLAAILPLYLSKRGPLRLARFVGHGVGDVLGPIYAKDDAEPAGAAVRQALSETDRSWDLLLAERLPKDRAPGLLPGEVLQEEANPYLPVGGMSWDDYLASCSSNMRSQIRRKRRKLEREHGARFRLTDDRERLDDDLDSLLRLHEARWGEPRAFSERRAAFHRDFAARALERGWLRLWTLEADGQAVAAWLGFRFGGVEWYYQSGRDPRWDGRSVGLTLLARTIQGAFDDGMSAYAFLRGDEEYKKRFATEDAGLETVGIARGPLGRAAVSAARAAKRLPPGARHRVLSSLG